MVEDAGPGCRHWLACSSCLHRGGSPSASAAVGAGCARTSRTLVVFGRGSESCFGCDVTLSVGHKDIAVRGRRMWAELAALWSDVVGCVWMELKAERLLTLCHVRIAEWPRLCLTPLPADSAWEKPAQATNLLLAEEQFRPDFALCMQRRSRAPRSALFMCSTNPFPGMELSRSRWPTQDRNNRWN